MKQLSKNIAIILLTVIFVLPTFVFASETNGTIDITHKYAWSENIGWINFGCAECNVHIIDSGITGHAWSENYGWIILNPSTSGVLNNNEGTLSGQAWGENTGWINFLGVTIDSSGYFSGYASGDITGQISFNCSNTSSCGSSDFKVRTDWRPASSRSSSEENNTNSSGSVPVAPSTGSGKTDSHIGIGETKSGYVMDSSGRNFLVYINSQINFTIEGSNTQHNVNIIDLNIITGRIKIELRSELTTIELDIGEEKEVDLDNDGKNDIKVKYNELIINRVDITITQLAGIEQTLNNNDLVKEFNNPTVYLIENNKKRPIQSEQAFIAKGFFWSAIIEVNDLSAYDIGVIIAEQTVQFSNNDLVKEFNNPAVYLIQDNKKQPIFNEQAFISNGFKWSDIKETDDLSAYQTGAAIKEKTITQSSPAFSPSVIFTYRLSKGMKNADIMRLQELLSTQFDIYPEGLTTGYFGSLTEKAIQRFQLKYEVVNSADDSGFGFVGPKTRAEIREVFGG